MAEPTEVLEPTTKPEPVPEVPPPVEIPEYYTGFAQEFGQMSVELQGVYKRLQEAEKKLSQPVMAQAMPEGFWRQSALSAPWTWIVESFLPESVKAQMTQDAMAEFDAAARAFQMAEWKLEVMQVLPIYLSDPYYEIDNIDDVLKLIAPGVELTDADTAWLNETYGNLSHLTNVLPEDYSGDILDAQSKILNEILTEPKLELKGVHRLTIEEIAKAFAFGVAELPDNLTAEDVRSLLSQFDLQDEELQNQREWLAERAREWEIESARMNLIRASEILAETPELTPGQWAKLIVTQPMMATVEVLQKWWDAISRPISSAIMIHTPAPASGAIHGVALGAAAGGTIGAILAPFSFGASIPVGAAIGALVGAIGGAAWFSTWEDEASKELTKIYDFYVADGDSSWSAYAKAFNEWDAPWWKKMILDSAYDPLMWIGWGGVAAVGNKIARIAAPRGLRWFTKGIGTTMVAFERGFIAGSDVIFKAGMEVVAAPAKFGFWLTGAGYTIPRTLFQMSKNFGRQTMMDLLAVAQRRFPAARLVRGKLVGLSTKDFQQLLADVTSYALKHPTNGDTMARAGIGVMEFAYRNADDAAKLLKGIVDDAIWDTATLAKFNSNLADAITGFVSIPGVAVTHGDRMAAGNILSIFNKTANLSEAEGTKLVNNLASRIGKFKEGLASRLVDSVADMAPGDAIYHIFEKIVDTRYSNFRNPITEFMGQAGRSVSWHSRVSDQILHSARLVAFERRVVMPFAKHQLLFTNFGPYNYLENSMRSFLGGADAVVPKAFSGVDETLEVIGRLSGCPYELVMLQRGERRLVQAIVNPETGRALTFKGGNIPIITRNVVIPEKIPRFGGKQLGTTITIGDKRYFLGSAQDWYDMWADLVGKQMAYDYQVHFTKALYDTPLGKETIDGVNDALSRNRYILKDGVPSIHRSDISDVERLTRWRSLNGPEDIRAMANVEVLDYNRRLIGRDFNKARSQMYDMHRITGDNLYDQIIDGTMFSKGYASIDDGFAGALAWERDMGIVSLSPQITAMQDQVDWLLKNPPKNLDDFLWDMQTMTGDLEAVRATIHDYRKISRIRSGQMIAQEADNFEVGSAKELARYMNESEENLVKALNQMMENARTSGLSEVQLARLQDLNNINRMELENVLAIRTKLAEIESEIPAFHSRVKKLWRSNPDKAAKESKMFWTEGANSQRARKIAIWEGYDDVADRLKFSRLESSRNFLMSVDRTSFLPDYVPEVVDRLTPNHLAYLYGVTGDDLYRGLTRIQHNTMVRPKKDFIIHTREQASAYGAKVGKTADQLGFTEEAIGEVYDQMWRSLGVDPTILTPDSPVALQLEELRQEVYRLYAANRVPADEVAQLRKYFNTVADDVENLAAYKAAPPAKVIKYGSTRELAWEWTCGADAPDLELMIREALHSLPKKPSYTIDEISGALMAAREKHIISITSSLKDETASMFKRESFVRELAATTKVKLELAVPKPAVSGTPEWWATKESAMPKTRELHALAYPTYDDANVIDETMRAIFPFWNYELFRWKWLPRTFMRTPGVMSGLARYMDYTDSGYVPVPGTDLQLNPLRGTVFMGGLRSFYLRDFPEYHDAIPGIEFLDYIGRAGFFPGIHVMLPIVGVSSIASGEKFQWGELAPAWVKSSLSALRSLSPQHIGAVLDMVYPDRFRDYMTMLELASMGYDADEIWKKKKQDIKLTEEEEKLWLHAVNKVDGLKGVLMNQTGLFRIRPAEFAQIRQHMRLAIEEATGVPVATQEWIDKMYPVTGKRFSDYFHLDIQQQALLYQWESYRRYQGIIEPLYPSSWQALDIKTSDYYAELERIYNDSRYNGVYEDGRLIQQSMVEINRQLVGGIIGPDQWRSLRSDMQKSLGAAADALGNSPAYKDVPKTFEERVSLLEERGVVTPTQTPDQELLYYYYELEPQLKWNWESERMELDFDTYYAYIDILLESLSPTFRERLLERLHMDWTPLEILYWQFSRDFARPYRNLRAVVLNEYTDEQVKTIRRFEVARGAERLQLLEVMGPDGKLISGYQRQLREARLRLRILDPTLDAWLNFFGTTDKLVSTEAEEIYSNLRKQYLVPAMVGEAK